MRYSAILVGLLVLCSTQVLASDTESFAHKKGCFGCHDIDREVVGPSWKAVADKYSDQENASHQLAGSILYGSMGNWGDRPMRGHAKKINRDDALRLAEFILDLK